MDWIRIPARFITDHDERALDTPVVQKATTQCRWIDRHDPALQALVADARHYADRAAQDHDYGARALLRALAAAGVEIDVNSGRSADRKGES